MTYNPLPYFISTVGDKTWLTKTGHPSASVQIGNNSDLPIMKRWKSGSSLTDSEQQAVGYYCGLLERQIIDLGNAIGFGATNVRDVKGEGPIVPTSRTLTREAAIEFVNIRQEIVQVLLNELTHVNGDSLLDVADTLDVVSVDTAAESLMMRFTMTTPIN